MSETQACICDVERDAGSGAFSSVAILTSISCHIDHPSPSTAVHCLLESYGISQSVMLIEGVANFGGAEEIAKFHAGELFLSFLFLHHHCYIPLDRYIDIHTYTTLSNTSSFINCKHASSCCKIR